MDVWVHSLVTTLSATLGSFFGAVTSVSCTFRKVNSEPLSNGKGIWFLSHVPRTSCTRMQVGAPYGQDASSLRGGSWERRVQGNLLPGGRHCLFSHPVGLELASWASPGLQIVRRRHRRTSQQAVALTCDVCAHVHAMVRSLFGSCKVDL